MMSCKGKKYSQQRAGDGDVSNVDVWVTLPSTLKERENKPESQNAADERHLKSAALLRQSEAQRDNEKDVIVNKMLYKEEAGNGDERKLCRTRQSKAAQ